MITKTPPERGAFDYLLKPAVPLDPPLPPDYGGGPQRIRVEIEIVQRAPPPRRPTLVNVFLRLLLLALLWMLLWPLVG